MDIIYIKEVCYDKKELLGDFNKSGKISVHGDGQKNGKMFMIIDDL